MERLSLNGQRSLIDELSRLVDERRRAAAALAASRANREAALADRSESQKTRIEKTYRAEKQRLTSEHSHALGNVVRAYEEAVEAAVAEQDGVYREIVDATKRRIGEAASRRDKAHAAARHQRDAAIREAAGELNEFKRKIEMRREELGELEEAVERIMKRRRCARLARQLPEREGVCRSGRPLEQYSQEYNAARAAMYRFGRQWAAPLSSFSWLVLTVVIIGIAGTLLGAYLDALGGPWVVANAAIAVGLAAMLYVLIRPLVVRQTMALYGDFLSRIANANRSLDAARAVAMAEGDRKRLALRAECEQQCRQADQELAETTAELDAQREARLRVAADQLEVARDEAAARRDDEQADINARYESEHRALDDAQKKQLDEWREGNAQEAAANEQAAQRAAERMAQRWEEGIHEAESAIAATRQYCEERFPPWASTDWPDWICPEPARPLVRFGEYTLDFGGPDGEPHPPGGVDAAAARDEEWVFRLPAVMDFGECPLLCWEAWGEGRAAASRAMRNVMLRLFTSLPPGKVRFTIIDPVGLGQNFAAFMHLADLDEQLVSHRIWTEPPHIASRLSDLTEHMEDVLQTYLRNEFENIEQYNQHAGEVAEPFHVLVVANFPAGFTDEAAQRLLSIAASGGRCGVYTLLSTDSKLEWPRNVDLEDLTSRAVTLQWDGHRFRWKDPDLKNLPLELEPPPEDTQLTGLIREFGTRAQQAGRVEVPFATVAPTADAIWQQDARRGIDVALGRAGATKLQALRLGTGTSQHVLIAGKTGSGKSTLLHVLITNTALHYSPDEVEFYLIDFKKGVEFKPYATERLPHARVVAIESEREFGMSVLERLDVELRRRGDLFRDRGVQELAAFRDAHPDIRLPRVLLIIDEFQEFFVQDDRLAQDAALLLDRLVRQGRAFGIHVLLGSQTLAGAYSLARSTIGQMAVRIALQCSETDSHLILSEDNTAARLLHRPGEAIYNDANGLFEGNHPFQVVWLSADEQAAALRQLRRRADAEDVARQETVVFEGNAPADPRRNTLLRAALDDPAAAAGAAPRAYLGSAVAIKDPTSIELDRHSGSNLLLVGQQEDMAQGILANSIISLAAHAGAGKPRFFVLDGTRTDTPGAGFWNRFRDTLPLDLRLDRPAGAGEVVGQVHAEVTRRVEEGDEHAEPIYLIVYQLARFRDLRRRDDDFGFSSLDDDERPADPARQLADILRDGPASGVHVLIWCDTFNNINRAFDRHALRDLDDRVLFQMSATDSSNLMDTPAASRLGPHRAILYSEERGEMEKFRPYGLPTDEWLKAAGQDLSRCAVSDS